MPPITFIDFDFKVRSVTRWFHGYHGRSSELQRNKEVGPVEVSRYLILKKCVKHMQYKHMKTI